MASVIAVGHIFATVGAHGLGLVAGGHSVNTLGACVGWLASGPVGIAVLVGTGVVTAAGVGVGIGVHAMQK